MRRVGMPTVVRTSFVLPTVIAIVVAMTFGCSGGSSSEYIQLARDSYAFAPESRINYRDRIRIDVHPDNEMSGEFTVAPDGVINYPYLGDVHVANRNCHEIERLIRELLADGYLRQPSVNCSIVDMNSQKVFVTGAVGSQSSVPYRDDLTVLDVYMSVGGANGGAAQDRVKLIRVVDGVQREFMIPLSQIVRGRAPNLRMWPGDLLYVPTAGIIN